jgi:hypothetical protein
MKATMLRNIGKYWPNKYVTFTLLVTYASYFGYVHEDQATVTIKEFPVQ